MGLITLLLDAVTTSALAAVLRRATGYSVHAKLGNLIKSPGAKSAVDVYFGIGEFIVDKGAKALQGSEAQQISQNAAKKTTEEIKRTSERLFIFGATTTPWMQTQHRQTQKI
jgi:hypothetical protein